MSTNNFGINFFEKSVHLKESALPNQPEVDGVPRMITNGAILSNEILSW